MTTIILVTGLLTIVLLLLFFTSKTEGYSPAALTQLMARDPQDSYLTNDSWKYLYYPYSPYDVNVWGYPHYRTLGMRKRKSARPLYINPYPYYNSLINYQ